MGLTQTIIIIIVGLFLLMLVMFGDFRAKLKVLLGGFLNVFVEDVAKTPEGAEAVYQQVIEEAQVNYNKADTMLRQLSGQLHLAQRELSKSKEMFEAVSRSCEALVKDNKIELAQVKAEERETLEIEISTQTKAVKYLMPLVEDAKDMCAQRERELEKLKRDKKQKVAELRLNNNLAKAYDDMNTLKKDTGAKKLLESVNDGLKTSQENAVGAKVVHQNKLSTKVESANKVAKSLETSDYITELKKKYNQK